MCGGLIHLASDAKEAAAYLRAVAYGVGLPQGYGDPGHIYPHYPKALAEEISDAWGKGVVGTKAWLASLGPVEFKHEAVPSPAFPQFPGAQSYGIFCVAGRGIALFKLLTDAVACRETGVLWETPGKRLIANPAGEIVGVVAEQGGKEINIKARRAVVLATGGFEYDQELVSAFLPGWGWTFMGNPANTGDGLRMAMGAGAALGHMPHVAARVVAGGPIAREIGTGIMCDIDSAGRLLVDNYGRRYINECYASRDPERYQFYNQVVAYDITRLEYPRIPSWFIFDERVRQRGPVTSRVFGAEVVGIYKWSSDNQAEIAKGWILKGDTIEELAGAVAAHPDNKRRMEPATLASTIMRFNECSRSGSDPEFGRDATSLGALSSPPFYAIAEYPGGPNTEGGPIKNARAQAISVFGHPIPRLYCVGELGSIFSFAYQAGGNIAEIIIFGQIAGKNAAAEKPWC
ncbi:MAG TPA: FAD-binding protein [Anaerolineae bacterium]|nr:FAD-binding protein [Anaerolineae bacterium]